MSEALSEREFETTADETLREIARALDEVAGDFEADLESGILTIEFSDGAKYIVNSHRAARQIWMAAERNAWHFDWSANEAAWRASKTDDELWSALERVISTKLGRPVPLRGGGSKS